MKKKLLIMALVLGLTSMANATTVTWSTSAITIDVDEVDVVQIDMDDTTQYGIWVGASDPTTFIADITAIAARLAAGDNAAITENYLGWNGWWYLEGKDLEEPYNIASGSQWDVSIKGISTGSFQYSLDDTSQIDGPKYLNVTVIPEPMTIALLGLGGLLLRRRK
jgi:hypothetical protein